MAIDAYSLCPGGTGKKIKFCCNDFLPELQKIDRMIDGEQYQACLKHIDDLMANEPERNRECLLATKCSLLRITDQIEAARTTAALFLTKHPTNPIALAEMAMLAAEYNAPAALDFVLQALRASNGQLSTRVYQAMGMTAGALLHAGLPVPARALLELQADVVENDERPGILLAEMSQAVDVPLLLREDMPLLPCPEGAAWRERFEESVKCVSTADWKGAADVLAALVADVPNASAAWMNLAALRAWSGDNAGSIEALRKYAALRAAEADGLEDAVEAEARAMFLAADPLGDQLDMLRLTWTVKDVERLQESLLSSSQFQSLPFDPARFSAEDSPPPKAAFMLLDRPMPESAEGLTLDKISRLLGQVLLFGRQTDREARLEILGVSSHELSLIKDLVSQAAGDAVEPQPLEDVIGGWSASQSILRTSWLPPRDAAPETIGMLADQYRRDAVLQRWPNLKLGALDGRTPREAADDDACRTRVLAAILVLEHWSQQLPGNFDMNELREQLGLPVLGPIENASVRELPVGRLARLHPESLSDGDLLVAFYRAGAYAQRPAMRKLGEVIIHRPSMADSNERGHVLSALARSEEDVSRAIGYVEQGRQTAHAHKQSCASWDLLELSIRFAERNGMEAMRLIQHVQDRHMNEPHVGEALTQMLIDVGLLRPDGTPAFGAGGPMAPEAQAPAAEQGGLWTPDSAQPSGGGGKLWTPE